MNDYKAAPHKWRELEVFSSDDANACILELRARVEALEAQANHFGDINKMVPPPVATDEELSDAWHKGSLTPDGRYIIGRKGWRAVYNLGIEHGQAGSRDALDGLFGGDHGVQRARAGSDGAAKTDIVLRFGALELPRIAGGQPVLGQFELPAVLERLAEDAGPGAGALRPLDGRTQEGAFGRHGAEGV